MQAPKQIQAITPPAGQQRPRTNHITTVKVLRLRRVGQLALPPRSLDEVEASNGVTTLLAIDFDFVVRMVETGRFFDASGFLVYLDFILALCTAPLLFGVLYHGPFSVRMGYMWWISGALRGMLASGMAIAIFAVAQSLVDIPFRSMLLDVPGSEEHAGLLPLLSSDLCPSLQGIPPTVSQWVTGNSDVIAEELQGYATAVSTKVKTFIICEATWPHSTFALRLQPRAGETSSRHQEDC